MEPGPKGRISYLGSKEWPHLPCPVATECISSRHCGSGLLGIGGPGPQRGALGGTLFPGEAANIP